MTIFDRILGPRLDLEPGNLPWVARRDLRAVERYERELRSVPKRAFGMVEVEAFERLTATQMQLHFDRATATRCRVVPPATRPDHSCHSVWASAGRLSRLSWLSWLGWLANCTPAALGWIVWSDGYVGPGFQEGRRWS